MDTDREPPGTRPAVEAWRVRMLASILRVVFVLATIAVIPSVVFAAANGHHAIAAVDLVALGALAVLTFWPRLGYRTRSLGLIVLTYAVGAWFLGFVGVTGQVYLIAFPVITALLLGLRPAVLAIAITAVTLVAAGLLDHVDDRVFALGDHGTLEWLVIALNIVFVTSVLTIPAAVVLRRLESSIANEQATSHSLEEQRQHLAERNLELEHEVAERRRAEAEVHRLAKAIAQARDLILIADVDGTVVYTNHSANDLVADPVVPRITRIDELGGDEHASALRDAIEAQRPWSGDVRLASSADEIVLDAELAPVRSPDGAVEAFVAVLRDVTTERQMEVHLRRSEKLEALGTLASGVAHDFNNVLATVLAVAEARQLQPGAPGIDEDMGTIITACGRARDVVRQMMTFGRHTDVDRHATSLLDTVYDTLPLLRASLPSRVALLTDLAADGPVRLRTTEIDQILINLVTNATQALVASDTDSPRVRIGLHHAGDDAATPRLALTVSDNGPGIAPEHLRRIFDPFFTTKGPTEGTGLGLASVHAAVTSLRGEIDVDSRPGQGATFTITLPVDGEAVDAVPLAGQPGPQVLKAVETTGTRRDHGGTAGIRILLVDDEQQLRTTMAQALGHLGHMVTPAVDGDDAMTAFAAAPEAFDIVITDLTMPGRDGVQLLRDARAHRPLLPVILCSGYADAASAYDLAADEVSAWLDKPYTIRQLAAAIEAAVGADTAGEPQPC